MKVSPKIILVILQIFAFVDIPIQRYLKDIRSKTFNSFPYSIYLLIALILFGIILGAFMNYRLKREDVKILILLLFVNIIGAITCLIYFHRTPAVFIILAGFIFSNIIYLKKKIDYED